MRDRLKFPGRKKAYKVSFPEVQRMTGLNSPGGCGERGSACSLQGLEFMHVRRSRRLLNERSHDGPIVTENFRLPPFHFHRDSSQPTKQMLIWMKLASLILPDEFSLSKLAPNLFQLSANNAYRKWNGHDQCAQKLSP
jgi:hypothetical protein